MGGIKKISRERVTSTLGDVCTFYQGYGFPKRLQGQYDGEYPFYKVGDISKNVQAGNTYLEFCENHISQSILKELRAKASPKNTIVFAKIGEALKLNRRALIRFPGIVDNNAIGLKADDRVCADFFLFHFLNCLKLENYSRATTVPSVRKSDIEAIEIPLPPLPEQHRIVAKIEELFSRLDKGIENLKTAQQQLKIYRQAVLKWAFEGKLTNKNVVDGELPETWKWVKVAEISKVVRGGSPRPAGDQKYYDGNIPFLKVADITKDKSVFLTTYKYTIKEAGLHKTRRIPPNTLLLSNSGATLGVPKICMIDATMNDGIAAFLDLDQRNNLYLYYFWLSKTRELRNINMGAAQPNLNTDILKNYMIPYCSFETQVAIVAEIESRLSVCDRIEETINESLKQAEALRQSILKKAFEGKLVPQDPNEEPASQILSRIKAERERKKQEASQTRQAGKPRTKKAQL